MLYSVKTERAEAVIEMMRDGPAVCTREHGLPGSGQWLTQGTPGGGPPGTPQLLHRPFFEGKAQKGLASHKNTMKLT